ncbi:MAG: fibronectin type III-like domain-contianing protein [Thiolinea sp.]
MRELRAFAKTALLQPGASEELCFTLQARDLASWSVEQGDWVVGRANIGCRRRRREEVRLEAGL